MDRNKKWKMASTCPQGFNNNVQKSVGSRIGNNASYNSPVESRTYSRAPICK